MRELGVGNMEEECRTSSDRFDCDTKTSNRTKLVKRETLCIFHMIYKIIDTECHPMLSLAP